MDFFYDFRRKRPLTWDCLLALPREIGNPTDVIAASKRRDDVTAGLAHPPGCVRAYDWSADHGCSFENGEAVFQWSDTMETSDAPLRDESRSIISTMNYVSFCTSWNFTFFIQQAGNGRSQTIFTATAVDADCSKMSKPNIPSHTEKEYLEN